MKIKSPSKVTEEIGENTGQGFIDGLMVYIDKVSDVVDTIGSTTVEGMMNSIVEIEDMMNGLGSDAYFSSPVLYPTLDTSGIYDDILKLNATLGSIGDINVNFNREGNRDVVQAINDLDQRFNSNIGELSRSMSKMQVVMDSGRLVGELTGPIDNALYRRTAFRQRGM